MTGPFTPRFESIFDVDFFPNFVSTRWARSDFVPFLFAGMLFARFCFYCRFPPFTKALAF